MTGFLKFGHILTYNRLFVLSKRMWGVLYNVKLNVKSYSEYIPFASLEYLLLKCMAKQYTFTGLVTKLKTIFPI